MWIWLTGPSGLHRNSTHALNISSIRFLTRSEIRKSQSPFVSFFILCSINPNIAFISGKGNVQPTFNLEACVMKSLVHGCARVAHCVTARWRNFSHYSRPLRQYDVWFTCYDNREALTAAPTAHSVQKQAFRVDHWTSREASLRHSSGWGTEALSLSSVICAPVLCCDIIDSSINSFL